MRVTLQDVAKAAGLATSTVSRALRGSMEISEKTRARVREIANELGYNMNRPSASHSSRSSSSLGHLIVVTEGQRHRLPIPHQVTLSGVQAYAGANDIGLILVEKDFVRQDTGITDLLRLASGALFILPHGHSALMDQCQARGLPMAIANRSAAQLSPQPINVAVHTDEQKVADLIVEHLVELGHSKIAFAARDDINCMMRTRRDEFINALKKRNLPLNPQWIFMNALDAPGEVIDLLRLDDRPTSIICASDTIAIELLHILREASIEVPRDVSIIGVHNLEFTKFLSPPLTTVDIGLEEIGYEAARHLCEFTMGNHRRNVDIAFAPTLIERASVSSPHIEQ